MTDRQEAILGTDPHRADSDGDGLTDGEEVDSGTSPLLTDTDGDTYLDPHELHEGTDPVDPEDRIYVGYWPYNPNKDQIGAAGVGLELGDVLPTLRGLDQYGDVLDLYDLAQAEAEFILVHVTYAGNPEKQIEEWLATGDGSLEATLGTVRHAIDSGTVRFVTVLAASTRTDIPPVPEEAVQWNDTFHHPEVPVMIDDEGGIGLQLIQKSLDWGQGYLVDGSTMQIDQWGDTGQLLGLVEDSLD